MTSTLPLPAPTFLDVDGSRLATYVLEPEHGHPAAEVVLCHGTPWSASAWAPVAQALSSTFRVLLWDMPGYGAAAKPHEQRLDLVSQQRRLAALLTHWRVDRPHLVAHDIGGAVALGAHLDHHADYSSLFLLDAVVLEPWGSDFFRLVAANQQVFSALPAALHGALVREYIAGAVADPLHPEVLDALTAPWLGEAGQSGFYRQIAQLAQEDTRPLAARLGRVRCPVRLGGNVRSVAPQRAGRPPECRPAGGSRGRRLPRLGSPRAAGGAAGAGRRAVVLACLMCLSGRRCCDRVEGAAGRRPQRSRLPACNGPRALRPARGV